MKFTEKVNAEYVFKLLDEQIELSSKSKKKYRSEIDVLKKESLEFRQQYAM